MRSTIAPRSPAFLAMRSGAQVRMPLNLPLADVVHDFIEYWALSGRLRRMAFTANLRDLQSFRSASWSISFTWRSIERTWRSSDSVDFLAYKTYLTFILSGSLVEAAVPSASWFGLSYLNE